MIPIQGSETEAGTLMAGFHHERVLRGEAAGQDRKWTLTALEEKAEPNTPADIFSLDELQVLGLSGPRAVAVGRTNEGHLWEMLQWR